MVSLFLATCEVTVCQANEECLDTMQPAECLCKAGYVLKNGLCEGGGVVQVTGLVINETYVPALSNRASKEFKALANKIENSTLNYLKNDLNFTDLIGVQVVSFKNGSIVTDFVIIFPPDSNDTSAEKLINDINADFNDPNGKKNQLFADLGVDNSSLPVVKGMSY